MKRILINPILLLSVFLSIILGYMIGTNIGSNFLDLYMGYLSQQTFRYLILLSVIVIDYFLFVKYNYTSIICRYRSLYHYLFDLTKKSCLYLTVFFLLFNLTIALLNINPFWETFIQTIPYIFSDIIISCLILSLIKLLDVKTHNRALSSGIFLIFFAILDFLLENYNFYLANQVIFDFSIIFCFPGIYQWYFIIDIILIGMTIFLIALFTKLMINQDYLLEDKKNEEN